MIERQAELQLELGIAAHHGLIERVFGELRDVRLAHEAEHVGKRPGSIRIHADDGMVEIGNLRIRVAHLDLREPAERAAGVPDLHGRAVEHQLARQPRELRPGQLARRLQRGGHIGVVHVLDLRGDAEIALPRLAEREVVQIALDLELHAGRHARVDGVAHIVARVLGNAERQIAVHARAVGARGRARQIEHARKARTRGRLARIGGAPARARFARRIGVGELGVLHIDRQPLAIDLPVHVGRELLHGN